MINFSYADFVSNCNLKNILAIKEIDQNYDKFRTFRYNIIIICRNSSELLNPQNKNLYGTK
jgi:hypothetical protein